MRHIRYFLLLMAICMHLSACISTTVKGFTDPDFHSFTAHKILIDVPNALFDEAFANKTKNIDVTYDSMNNLFMPTRTYTTEEKAAYIKQQAYDAFLFIDITGDNQTSRVVAYQTNTTANAYSTGYGSAYASGSSTTVPVTAHNRRTTAKATLYDAKSGRIVWVSDIRTKAGGGLYMSNSGTVWSMVESVLKDLVAQGHLVKKQ